MSKDPAINEFDPALDEVERLARIQELFKSGKARELRGDVPARTAGKAAGVTHVSVRRWERLQRRANSPEALRYLDVLDALARVRKTA